MTADLRQLIRVDEDLIRMIARPRKRCPPKAFGVAAALQDASEELKVHVFDGRFEVDLAPSPEPFRKLSDLDHERSRMIVPRNSWSGLTSTATHAGNDSGHLFLR
jgi:hypothetical protein